MTTPRKTTKKTVKKQTSKAEQANKEDVVLSKPEQINVDQLIAHALLRYKTQQPLDKKHKMQELSHLALICEEYLSSFALIGYSLEDEKVVMFNMPTPKDEAALVDLLRATFLDIANNRP
jgi:hypothetical protein